MGDDLENCLSVSIKGLLTSAGPNEHPLTDTTANPPNRISVALQHQIDGCQSGWYKVEYPEIKGRWRPSEDETMPSQTRRELWMQEQKVRLLFVSLTLCSPPVLGGGGWDHRTRREADRNSERLMGRLTHEQAACFLFPHDHVLVKQPAAEFALCSLRFNDQMSLPPLACCRRATASSGLRLGHIDGKITQQNFERKFQTFTL